MNTIRFLADQDFNEHIVAGVCRREPAIEFLRVRDFGLQTRHDAEILQFAHGQQLLVASHDVNTMSAAATQRIVSGLSITGLLMIPQSAPASDIIDSMLLIWSVTELEDWRDQIVFLPL